MENISVKTLEDILPEIDSLKQELREIDIETRKIYHKDFSDNNPELRNRALEIHKEIPNIEKEIRDLKNEYINFDYERVDDDDHYYYNEIETVKDEEKAKELGPKVEELYNKIKSLQHELLHIDREFNKFRDAEINDFKTSKDYNSKKDRLDTLVSKRKELNPIGVKQFELNGLYSCIRENIPNIVFSNESYLGKDDKGNPQIEVEIELKEDDLGEIDWDYIEVEYFSHELILDKSKLESHYTWLLQNDLDGIYYTDETDLKYDYDVILDPKSIEIDDDKLEIESYYEDEFELDGYIKIYGTIIIKKLLNK